MKISIITVCFNSVKTIEQTIQSVISQTYQNIEYIVIDGDSSDGTVDIIKKYTQQISKWISEPDNGIYDAMNKGIKMCSGDLVGIINSDDFYINNTVISQIISKIKLEKVDSIYTNLLLVDSTNTDKLIRNCTYRKFKLGLFTKGWHPPHPSFFVKREVYEKYGKFDLSFKLAADYEFMLRVLEKYFITTTYFPIYTLKMRNGGASTSSFSHIKLSQKECLLAFKKNGLHVNKFQYFAGKYFHKLSQYTVLTIIKDLISKKI